MSRETRIGILSVIVIFASIWGYKFIKGRNILSTQQFFYAYYEEVGGMQPSTPVYNRGFQIGTVTDIYPKADDPKLIVIEMEIGKRYKIPKDAIAVINQSVMGDKSIEIKFEEVCQGEGCAKSGAVLTSKFNSIANTILPSEQLEDYMKTVNDGLKDVTKEMNKMTNDPENALGKTMVDLQATLANLRTTTALINRDLARNGKIYGILDNANNVTSSIDTSKIASLVNNANEITENVKGVNLDSISNSANVTLAEAQEAIKQLTKTVESADGAINEFNTLLAKINKGEGSLGKLANDDELYKELKEAAKNTNILMIDLQQRPNRYIPFKSGRKVRKIDKKNPLVLPDDKKN